MKIPIEEINQGFSYESLVSSYGYEIINKIELGDYSGDIIMIVGLEGKYGLLTTGYGSCSGCDNLLGCHEHLKELDELRTRLCENTIFMPATELIEYLDNNDWEGQYYGVCTDKKEFKDFLIQSKQEILFRHLARI